MFLIDKLLVSPMKGVLWIFTEIQEAARQEQAGEAAAISATLSELYMKLEAGQITSAEFDARERLLLDRLDSLQAREKPESAPVQPPVKRPSRARRPGRCPWPRKSATFR